MLNKEYLLSGKAHFLFSTASNFQEDAPSYTYTIEKNTRGFSVWVSVGAGKKSQYAGRLMPNSGFLKRNHKQGISTNTKALAAFEWLMSLVWWSNGILPHDYVIHKLVCENCDA